MVLIMIDGCTRVRVVSYTLLCSSIFCRYLGWSFFIVHTQPFAWSIWLTASIRGLVSRHWHPFPNKFQLNPSWLILLLYTVFLFNFLRKGGLVWFKSNYANKWENAIGWIDENTDFNLDVSDHGLRPNMKFGPFINMERTVEVCSVPGDGFKCKQIE